jgi:hypothetical protein
MILPLLETFLELLLQTSFQWHHIFFGCLQYLESLSLWHTLFSETASELERWSAVMVVG